MSLFRDRNLDVLTELLGICSRLTEQVQTLEREVAELRRDRASGGFKYCGTYAAGQVYVPGNFLTHQGSLWACLHETMAPPPGGSWRLAVKRGRDARTRPAEMHYQEGV